MNNARLLERRWPMVRAGVWSAAAAAVALAVVLYPSFAESWLSSDGQLSPASKRTLIVMQLTLVAVAGLLAVAGRRFRRHTPTNEYLVLGVVFAIGSVIGTALLCEASLRAMADVRPLRADRHFFFVHDDLLGWRHRAGAVAMFKDAIVRINADGLRDDEIAADRADGERRVLFLGDSQVFGDGVASEDTFVQRLEAEAEGGRLQALNAGVIGYGTDQQLLYYEKTGTRYGADITLVGLNAYDLRDNISARVRSGYIKPLFTLAGGRLELVNVPISKGSILDQSQRILTTQSYLYTLIDQTLLRRGLSAEEGGRTPAVAEVFPPEKQMNMALDVTAALLARLAATVRSRGGKLAVAFLPYEMDFVDDPRYKDLVNRLLDRLELIGHREGFLVFDLRSHLGSGRGLYLDRMHFNPEGHRRVAEALKGLLVQNALLPTTHVN
jgi:hypothetical protein